MVGNLDKIESLLLRSFYWREIVGLLVSFVALRAISLAVAESTIHIECKLFMA